MAKAALQHPLNPDDLVDFVYRILWTLHVSDPPFFRAQAVALGLSHEQYMGDFVGDCLAVYAPPRFIPLPGTPAGAIPDWMYLKQLAYENVYSIFVTNRLAAEAAAKNQNMPFVEYASRIFPNSILQYLGTLNPFIPTHVIPPARAPLKPVVAGNVATAEQLLLYVLQNIPNFIDVQLLGPGSAYHYTQFAQMTPATILGAPVTPNLDFTQQQIPSPAATHDPGVVFGYANQQAAVDESHGDPVKKLDYSAAVQATHAQEAGLGAPPTILIINREITAIT